MLIQFLKGQKRLFNGEELLGLLNSKYLKELRESSYLKIENQCEYIVSPIKYAKSYTIKSLDGKVLLLVDDKRKNILVETKALLSEFNNIYEYEKKPVYRKNIGAYKVYCLNDLIDEIKLLYRAVENDIILKSKRKIITKAEQEIANNNLDYDYLIKYTLNDAYKSCYLGYSSNTVPEILDNFNQKDLLYIYSYITNRIKFIKGLKDTINERLCMPLYNGELYKYFKIDELLRKKEIDNKLCLYKKIIESTKKIGNTLSVTTKKGEIYKVVNEFRIDTNEYISVDGKTNILADDISKISFAKKVLFQE